MDIMLIFYLLWDLIRIALVILIIYLVVRSFSKKGRSGSSHKAAPGSGADRKSAEATPEHETPQYETPQREVPTTQPGPQPENSFCPNCGEPVDEETVFCMNCGTKLR